jgi:hypothetical protein
LPCPEGGHDVASVSLGHRYRVKDHVEGEALEPSRKIAQVPPVSQEVLQLQRQIGRGVSSVEQDYLVAHVDEMPYYGGPYEAGSTDDQYASHRRAFRGGQDGASINRPLGH